LRAEEEGNPMKRRWTGGVLIGVAATMLAAVALPSAALAAPRIILSPRFNQPIHVAPPKFVVSGGRVLVWVATALNPDCSVTGRVQFHILTQPRHGHLQIATTEVFPGYPPDNPRSLCNAFRVSGQQISYTASKGYTGADLVEFESIYPAGNDIFVHVPIIVR
jgi:hypothetical protein